jgi:hypothetical protein
VSVGDDDVAFSSKSDIIRPWNIAVAGLERMAQVLIRNLHDDVSAAHRARAKAHELIREDRDR